MMTKLAQSLRVSDRPIIKKILDANGTKIMAIGLGRGVELKEHDAPYKTKLLVIKGEIDFNTATESRRYACYESFDIPMKVKHSVVAWNDAIFLLFLNEK